MALPGFNPAGDLPPGVHQATLAEIVARFGAGTAERERHTAHLVEIYELARRTEKLDRIILFGSYVTAKSKPNDIDVVLIMRDDFDVEICDEPARELFEHHQATSRFQASIFWIRPAMLLLESLDDFIAYWQIKRDQTRRGIIEVRA